MLGWGGTGYGASQESYNDGGGIGNSVEREVANWYMQGGYPWYKSGSGYGYDDEEGDGRYE